MGKRGELQEVLSEEGVVHFITNRLLDNLMGYTSTLNVSEWNVARDGRKGGRIMRVLRDYGILTDEDKINKSAFQTILDWIQAEDLLAGGYKSIWWMVDGSAWIPWSNLKPAQKLTVYLNQEDYQCFYAIGEEVPKEEFTWNKEYVWHVSEYIPFKEMLHARVEKPEYCEDSLHRWGVTYEGFAKEALRLLKVEQSDDFLHVLKHYNLWDLPTGEGINFASRGAEQIEKNVDKRLEELEKESKALQDKLAAVSQLKGNYLALRSILVSSGGASALSQKYKKEVGVI